MKIIHTGDWHIGKIVNDISMLEEQNYILERLLFIVEEEKPHALVLAGDIFDRSIPPVEAVELVDEIFSKLLLEMKVPILAVAGNHDSSERLSFASRILTNNGLHIAGTFDGNVPRISLEDKFGPVNFYLLPYTDPRNIRHIYGDNQISTHDDAMRRIIDKIGQAFNTSERNIMVTHGYVTQMGGPAEYTSDSERPLSIGGADFVSSEYFSLFNYTALGHLHAPQKAGYENVRYSGSLLKYSFSEVNQKKGVTVVELDEKGTAVSRHIDLVPKRDMRIIKGPVNELISPEVYTGTNTEDYIYAILTDKGELIDPISRLRAVYPNILGLTKEGGGAREGSKTSASQGYKSKSKLELFKEFYDSIQGEPLGEEGEAVMAKIIGEAEKEGI